MAKIINHLEANVSRADFDKFDVNKNGAVEGGEIKALAAFQLEKHIDAIDEKLLAEFVAMMVTPSPACVGPARHRAPLRRATTAAVGPDVGARGDCARAGGLDCPRPLRRTPIRTVKSRTKST